MTALAHARHIVWDWNGTLLDDNHAVVSAVNSVCTAFDREHIDIEEWRAVFSRPLLQCYERLLRRPLGDRDWARIDVLYHDAYRELLHTCGLASGVLDALRNWASTGRSQSLLSMWFHDELVPLVTEMGLGTFFNRVDGLRAEIGGGSKDKHLRHHLEAQGLDAQDVVLIGDVLDDAHAAEQAGTRCVLVTTGVMNRKKLETSGFPVADSVSEALTMIAA
ncbi:HAD family hydrolase [Saccharopolyspora sp. 5N708]|uniref:HAD family hydrolase n=1 Tax=Saccharopolyspora sp. 5N708 TaxID=3457424 RepID=UPI003FD49489